jgi:hypothetical protein
MVVEESVKELMNKIVKASASYSPEGDWKPPVEWSTTEQGIIDSTRDWLEKAIPKGHGTINPVLHVAENTYQIFTTTDSIYRWRRRLCARIQSKTPELLLAPSWDPKNKKTRLGLMLPQLARMVQTEFEDTDRLLQAAVNVMSMEAVTAPSPSKADVDDGGARRDTSRARRHNSPSMQRWGSRNFPKTCPGIFCACAREISSVFSAIFR